MPKKPITKPKCGKGDPWIPPAGTDFMTGLVQNLQAPDLQSYPGTLHH